MRSRSKGRFRGTGWAFCFFLACMPATAADWETTTRSESKIVFSGPEVARTLALYRYLPYKATDYKVETHSGVWISRVQSLPVLLVQLDEAAPGRHFPDYLQTDLKDFARSLSPFKDKALSFGRAGSATTALGKAEYLVFAADGRECAVFRQFDLTAAPDDAGTRGRIRLWGLHCPMSGSVGVGGMEALLARVGARGIALPETTARQGSPGDSLIRAIEGGDVEAFRKIAAEGFDPETVIQFSRPDFAGGRVISGPALNATVLFGRAEMTRLLLSEGASVDGRARRAICMAVAMRHREIVEMLVRHGLKVDGYAQCGRSRNLSPLELAERLNLTGIAEILREAGG